MEIGAEGVGLLKRYLHPSQREAFGRKGRHVSKLLVHAPRPQQWQKQCCIHRSSDCGVAFYREGRDSEVCLIQVKCSRGHNYLRLSRGRNLEKMLPLPLERRRGRWEERLWHLSASSGLNIRITLFLSEAVRQRHLRQGGLFKEIRGGGNPLYTSLTAD